MKNWAGGMLDTVSNIIEDNKIKEVKICTVKTLEPFIFTHQGVDLGTTEGDIVYVHPLFMSPVIELDESSMEDAQSFFSSTAYLSPSFEAVIEGTILDFIKDFYNFFKNWQSIFVLSEGDTIAVCDCGENTYLVLQKLAKEETERS